MSSKPHDLLASNSFGWFVMCQLKYVRHMHDFSDFLESVSKDEAQIGHGVE